MKKPTMLITPLLIISLTAFKVNNLPLLFNNLLNRAHMTFTAPVQYAEVPIVKNDQMNYDYALKNIDKAFEIRYTVRPLDSLLQQFEMMEKNKKPGDLAVSPNKFYYPAFLAIMSNLTGGANNPKITEFPKDAVKHDFNADWGASCICEAAGKFGNGYKYCMGVAIHKDNIADGYCFYLTNNASDYQTLLVAVFYTMKFK